MFSKRLLLCLVCTIFIMTNLSFAKEDEGKEYLGKVIKNFQEKCKDREGSLDYYDCWAENSPSKCKSLVYLEDKSAWNRCVYNCGNSGFFSRAFGECSY